MIKGVPSVLRLAPLDFHDARAVSHRAMTHLPPPPPSLVIVTAINRPRLATRRPAVAVSRVWDGTLFSVLWYKVL